ncbi:MAG: AI-2E family transporter [Planococcus sp. (in: firmicutes)]|uniref:AI-2E family transporter n=1 Tax=Planococcus halocryophilus TaxID=1215089 RepID=UPI001F0E2866|nr:AI-2E family transporter [Planococcus halocryophilus]MCH4826468.1 AI-2E family transporter [Planococcus halocryophilus]
MWIRKPFFEYTTAILLVAITLFFLGKIDYVLEPIQIIIATIFAPVLLGGLFYYLLRPIVNWLARFVPKIVGIGIIFTIIALTASLLLYFFGPVITKQVDSLVNLAPETVEEVTEESDHFLANFQFGGVTGSEIRIWTLDYLENLSEGLLDNVMNILALLMNIVIVLIVVPFVLFFLLKDDDKFIPHLTKYLPEEHKLEGKKILKDVDQTLSAFIVGQAFVAGVVGTLMYIGYLIIGLDYALSLAIFAMFLIIVPFLGPLIGIVPALFVALTSGDMWMAMKVILVLLVVQQIEGNLVTPNIMGNRLNIHPLTIILLLMIAGALYGFVGILIAIPTYAVLKTLVHNFRLFNRLRKKREVASKKEL